MVVKFGGGADKLGVVGGGTDILGKLTAGGGFANWVFADITRGYKYRQYELNKDKSQTCFMTMVTIL